MANKNIDLSASEWAQVNNAPITVPQRPPPVKLGREVQMKLNSWMVERFPSNVVYQYDVLIGSGSEHAGVVKKVLASKSLRAGLPHGNRWLFAGALIAWSSEKVDELRITVDLDAEQGREPGKQRPDVWYVKIKRVSTVRFDTLNAYLAGKADFDATILQSINFLDHLLREGPSQRMTQIKRNFYWPGQQFFDLGGGLQACKGLYQSIRIVHGQPQHKLSVNADVANTAFWAPTPLSQAVAAILGCRNEADLGRAAFGQHAATALKPLRRVHVEAKHRRGEVDSYCIERVTELTADKHKLTGGDQAGLTVAEYFTRTYRALKHPNWPLVKTTKGQYLPLELLTIKAYSQYNRKLSPQQTAAMIRMAVTVPGQRWNDIRNGLEQVKWDKDPYLNGYGLKISPDPVIAKGRLLPNPKVSFANGPVDPRTSGRWRVDTKKFLLPNKITLSSWGVGVIPDSRTRYDKAVIEKFINEFVKTYISHGGKVDVKMPFLNLSPANADVGTLVTDTYTKTGQYFNKTPQLLLFLLPDRSTLNYGRVKKSMDCRYGVPSQCMQYQNVMKCQGQYISNVLLKVHCKLGGTVARATGPMTPKETSVFKVPTMIVGADVSHPPPMGQAMPADEQPGSIAAITCSMDKGGVRYIANVNTNGWRVEMVQTENWTKLWKPMLLKWMSQVGSGRLPKHIFYMRDGVSSSQYSAVMNQEVKDMQDVIKSVDPASDVKIVVIVCSKRHHIRLVAHDSNSGDKNGNPLPGTVIETAVTHPYEHDFYMVSHVALKGTARPVHYSVIANPANISNEDIMTMIYEHCYQFSRATTPVSLFPAVYYADIAAEKGRYHDKNFGTNSSAASKPGGGGGSGKSPSASGSQAGGAKTGTKGSSDAPSHVPDLLPLHGNVLPEVMWWV